MEELVSVRIFFLTGLWCRKFLTVKALREILFYFIFFIKSTFGDGVACFLAELLNNFGLHFYAFFHVAGLCHWLVHQNF